MRLSVLQLILTFMLTSIVVYLYTVLAFNFFRKFYSQEEEGEEPDSKCSDMLSVCILRVLFTHFRPESWDRCHTCNFLAQFSRATKLQVWHGESREFLTVAQLYFRTELCCIVCNSVDRMLKADWSAVIVVFCLASVCCTYSSFCLIYFNLFNLFNLKMEWLDAKTL